MKRLERLDFDGLLTSLKEGRSDGRKRTVAPSFESRGTKSVYRLCRIDGGVHAQARRPAARRAPAARARDRRAREREHDQPHGQDRSLALESRAVEGGWLVRLAHGDDLVGGLVFTTFVALVIGIVLAQKHLQAYFNAGMFGSGH